MWCDFSCSRRWLLRRTQGILVLCHGGSRGGGYILHEIPEEARRDQQTVLFTIPLISALLLPAASLHLDLGWGMLPTTTPDDTCNDAMLYDRQGFAPMACAIGHAIGANSHSHENFRCQSGHAQTLPNMPTYRWTPLCCSLHIASEYSAEADYCLETPCVWSCIPCLNTLPHSQCRLCLRSPNKCSVPHRAARL